MSHSMKNKLINMGKTALGFRCIPLLPLATLMVCSLPAYAEYSFQVIDPPGSLYTQAFGINNAGKVIGVAEDGVDGFSFMYDMKRGEYTDLGSEMSIVEISVRRQLT